MIDNFDTAAYIRKQLAATTKLIASLKKEGIETSLTDETLNNVVFTKGDKVIKMSHHSFYRYSGMPSYNREDPKDKNAVLIIPVTDEMWLFDIIRPVVLVRIENA